MQTSKPTKNYYNHTYNSIIVGLNVPKKGIEKWTVKIKIVFDIKIHLKTQ